MSSKSESESPAESAPNQPANGAAEKAAAPPPDFQDQIVESEHNVTIAGVEVPYTVTAGRMVMKDEAGKAKAAVFFVAYTRTDVGDTGRRPLTISFNGGPGSSSVWLHLGLLGPRRVLSGDAGSPVPPPYRLVNNEYSLLDVTDIVFVDPVSTGYSRPAPGEDAKQFHGLEQDIESVGEFIRTYITRYKRWASPKYLIGESYGTTRAAGLAGHMQRRHGMYFNGLMLISSVLNFQTLHFEVGNDLPYVLFLPTYTATAWYHGRLAADLQQDLQTTIAEAEEFASGDYARALFLDAALPETERAAIVQRLARLTGLTESYIEQTNLRVEIHRFCKELLRSERRTAGRLDSRFTGFDRDAAGETGESDPSYAAILGAYTGAMNDYVRRDLRFESDLPYEVLTGLYERWDYGKHQNRYVDVSETLRSAISQNPFLKVIIANGYYDLATPYFATEYTVNHLALAPDLRANVSLTYYEAGHMMYVHEPSLAQLRADLVAFLRDSRHGEA